MLSPHEYFAIVTGPPTAITGSYFEILTKPQPAYRIDDSIFLAEISVIDLPATAGQDFFLFCREYNLPMSVRGIQLSAVVSSAGISDVLVG